MHASRYRKMHLRAELGAGLIELALVLPVILILAAGIINFGMMVWQIQLALESGKYGARSAQIAAEYIDISGTPTGCMTNPDLTNLATTANNKFVTESEMQPTAWESVSIDPQVVVPWDGKNFTFMRVGRATKPNNCSFCFSNVLQSLAASFEGWYPIDDGC